MFTQLINPLDNLTLTCLVALVPVVSLLVMLAVFRLPAWLATLLGSIITFALAVWVWKMPFGDGAHAYVYGAATGVWNVDWITFWGMVLFNTLGVSGVFENFRRWLIAQGSMDVRVQTMLFAWAFGALLEGLVGFGYPWAVVAPILISLGISDLNAIRVAAIANNAPVSFGALGAPIIALAAVTGYPLLALSASVGTRGRRARAAAAVGALVPGLGQGRNERRLAARGGRFARLYRGPVSGRRPSRTLSARHHRRDRLLHRAARIAQILAAEIRTRLWRRAGRCRRRQSRCKDTDSSSAKCCRPGCRSPCC